MKQKHLIRMALIAILLMGTHRSSAQGVAINTTLAAADTSAMLDVKSTSKGMLVPRMDSAQCATISSPATGLLVYQTDGVTPGFYNYTGSIWQKVGATVQPHVQVYSTAGTYTLTTSSNITAATVFKITMLGGGGGGGGGAGPGSIEGTGGGGGASAYTVFWGSGFSPNTAYPVTVGAGGSGGAGGGNTPPAGGDGGTSSAMGVSCIGGGGGGGGRASSGSGGNGGIAIGGTLTIVGASGTGGSSSGFPPPGGAGGSSAFGVGGNGSVFDFGFATGNGSGGGGGFSQATGGSGTPGIVIIEWSE